MALNSSHVLIDTVPILGVTLLLCLVIGKLSKKFGIPKVSGYIILGIILGPELFNHLTHEFTASFSFFNDLALGLILFNIGGEFNRKLFLKLRREQVLQTLLMSISVFIFVFIIFFSITTLFKTIGVQESLIVSLFLGLVAIEAAPPTTLLVLKEYNASGDMTTSIKIYLAFATIFAVMGTLLMTKVLGYISYWPMANGASAFLFIEAIWNILGSIIFGVILGIFLSYFERFETKIGNIFFAIISSILVGQSLANYLNIDPLLISLFLGFTVANASSVGDDLHEHIKNLGGSIYALFFVLAGTHIKFSSLLTSVGLLGVIYIISRISGIVLANYFASRFIKIKSLSVKKYMGLGVISHAGAALAIVTRVSHIDHPSTEMIFNIVVSSIFVFELLGPLLLKYALLKSGEISSWYLQEDKTSKLRINLRETFEQFKKNIIVEKKKELIHSSITEFINTDVMAIQADANIENIKEFLKSNNLIYPVVDKEHKFLGSLNIHSINRLNHTNNNPLVTARNLIADEVFIPSNTSPEQAHDIFSMTQRDVLPVVDTSDGVLVGIIYHKDILVSIQKKVQVI